MKKYFLPSIVVFAMACAPQPEIDRAYVDRIISTLAADDMRGRQTFSEEIERAASFLEEEFDAIGLEKLEGLEGYQQRFELYEIAVESLEVTINGDVIEEAFGSLDGEDIEWGEGSEVIVTYIGADDDFGDSFQTISRNDDNLLVLIDPSHSEMIGRYKRFISRPSRKTEVGVGRSVVYVVTEIKEAETFEVVGKADISTRSLANVAGQITGNRADEYVLFSAHYDHIGIRPAVDGDSIANGANDDASGTAAVAALAKYFSEMPKPERTILFVAFTAEEMGGYGSRYFSEQLNPDQLVAMFNIEMIGKPAVSGPNSAWITGFERSTFGELLQKSVEGTEYEFYADPYPDQNLFYRSDNATLARLGVPAHSISTTPIDVDEDYHQVSDHVETLDIDHMTNTIKAIAKAAVGIISGEDTPTRVDKDSV